MEGMFARLFPMITREHDDARSKGEVIHSGHFMISSVADQDELDDDVSHDRDSPVHHEEVIRFRQGYDFSEVRKETQNTYQFGHRSTNQITIDASLSRLFECMSLAYRGGKVVSPKWKNFKGMKLSVKDKIRLNNAIWRTWHIQYIMKKKRNKISFVQFATPLDNEFDCDSHSKPEAVVMEGKYWKRRIETVVAEYKKWRAFFMEKWVTNQSSPSTPESFHSSLDAIMRADDNTFSDLADRLFSRMSQPFQFPNPREIAQHATNSDMMQPGLLQLQPPIDDFMDPLDTLHDIFSTNRRSPNNGANNINSLFYAGNNTQSSTVAQLDFPTPMITQQDFQASGMQEVSLEELVQKATAGFDPPIMCVSEGGQTMLTRQQEAPMQVQRTNNNYRVSDPMPGKAPSGEQMFAPIQQNALMPTTIPMMVSKQQPETATMSQVVKSRPQHNSIPVSYNNNNQQTKVQTAMPPPQKAPPRRKSFHKMHNNVGAYVQPPIVSTMASQLAPQLTNTADTPMVLNYTQAAPPINNNQGQVPPGFRVSVQQAVITPRMSNLTIPLQPVQMQVDKAPPQHQMNNSTGLLQAAAPDVRVETGNSNSRSINGCGNTQGLGRQPPPLIVPISVQQTMSNQYMNSCDQPPPQKKALLVGQQSNPGIVVKQPSSTILNSQHISARQQTLTQLLTSGKGQTLQLPPNMVLAPTREVQLKQVREQAVNFNTFQNSVLMAAAQMATAPQLQQIQSQNGNSANANAGSAAVLNLATGNEAPNKSFVSIPQSSNQDSKVQWGLSTSTRVTTMDTDEDPPRPRDDFLNQKEEKSYSASPASSSSSPCSDQRAHHFTAEQKRRCNIKSLCDKLQEILPDISNHPNQRVSKAVLLNKSCHYIRQLQSSRQQTASEIQTLKKKIETLNQGISEFQQQLPATGVPVSRHRGNRMNAVFDEWVRDRTLTDWKFFMFSMIIRPWFMSYDNTVSNSSLEEMCRTCLLWLEKHCSMPALRRGVVNSLQELGTTTSILTDPATLQQQAESAVRQRSRQSSTSS